MNLREDIERIFVFEMTKLKAFQDAADGTLDISGMDLREAVAASLVYGQAVHAMVLRVADEVDALRD